MEATDIKISQMALADTLVGDEIIPIVLDGINKSTTITKIKDGLATSLLLESKVDKELGKQLSTEDFTTELKTKLDNLNAESLVNGDSTADWYGVSWSEQNSNPDCTRIGNLDMHKTLPIQSKMRGCIINNAIDSKSYGAIRYLSDDWTKVIDDDTTYTLKENLNVFVEIPDYWYIDDYIPETETHNLKLSDHPKAGWFHHKKSYVAAYEGYMVKKEHTSYYMSKKGVLPTVNVSRTELRTASRNNSINKGCEYNFYLYAEHRALFHLFLVEYATRNSLKAVNYELTEEGFHQGGLGVGISQETATINGTIAYSQVPTGSSDSLGNSSGEVTVTVLQTDSSGNNTTTVTRTCNRYRGIENPFGHIYKHTDDVISVYDETISLRRYYLCDNPEYFSTNKNEHYKFLTSGVSTNEWVKSITVTPTCDFFAKTVNGSNNTYWCDYNYANTLTTEKCLLVGLSAGFGLHCGFCAFNSNYDVSNARSLVGSRLVYLPYMEKLNTQKDYSNAYGVEWDVTVANPQITRIGNPLLHKSLPIQSAYKGCIANGNKIVYYLQPDDWSKKEDGTAAKLDGTDGTVRVHTPKFYGKSEVDGNKRRVWISTTPVDHTWMEIPEMLIDAYRCTFDRTNPDARKAVSVVNTTEAFRGGGNRASYDLYLTTEVGTKDPFRSDLCKPITAVTRASMRTYAANANSELLCYEYYKWIFFWNYVIEYANFNSQAGYSSSLTPEGYHKGGLGSGISLMANWGSYNGYYPLTPCGYGNSIGNFTGLVDLTIPEFNYNKNTVKVKEWSPNSTTCVSSNGDNDSKIVTEVKSINAEALLCESTKTWGAITYNITGLTDGLKVIFKEKQSGSNYTNAVTITEATADGEITVNWSNYNVNANRYIGFAITQTGCNIKIYSTNVNTIELTQPAIAMKMPRWRGFDNPFGDTYTDLDGIILQRPAANLPSKVYTTTNPELFGDSDEIMNMMTIAGTEIASEGWITAFDLGDKGDIIPSKVGGSPSTYMCDYHYCNASSVNKRTLLVGLYAINGSSCGLGAFASSYDVSGALANVGFRTLSRV